jgi:hypothetical protein
LLWTKPILLILNGEWDIFGWLILNILSIIKNAWLPARLHVYILQTTNILFYVLSERCILHVRSLEKNFQPFKLSATYNQIISLNLTCQMIVLVKARVISRSYFEIYLSFIFTPKVSLLLSIQLLFTVISRNVTFHICLIA